MATDKNTPAQGGSNKTLWLVIMALVLVIVTGGAVGGTYMFMNDGSKTEPSADEPPKPPAKPVFVAIEPFTANLQDPRGRILYVRISVKVDDPAQAARLQEHMPQVRNRILMTLTDAEADRLTTAEGKQALAENLQLAIAEPFVEDGEPIGLNSVLFTDFIVQ